MTPTKLFIYGTLRREAKSQEGTDYKSSYQETLKTRYGYLDIYKFTSSDKTDSLKLVVTYNSSSEKNTILGVFSESPSLDKEELTKILEDLISIKIIEAPTSNYSQ